MKSPTLSRGLVLGGFCILIGLTQGGSRDDIMLRAIQLYLFGAASWAILTPREDGNSSRTPNNKLLDY